MKIFSAWNGGSDVHSINSETGDAVFHSRNESIHKHILGNTCQRACPFQGKCKEPRNPCRGDLLQIGLLVRTLTRNVQTAIENLTGTLTCVMCYSSYTTLLIMFASYSSAVRTRKPKTYPRHGSPSTKSCGAEALPGFAHTWCTQLHLGLENF